jgi:DNA-binding NarL/FixJ family response regulator
VDIEANRWATGSTEGVTMSGRLSVMVCGDDPITEAGVATQMRGRPEVFVNDLAGDQVDVVVVVVERLGEQAECLLRNLRRSGHAHIVVVCAHIDDDALMRAVELGASGVLRRVEATPERLSATVVAAARGDGQMAPDLLGRLLEQMSRLQQQVLAPKGISPNGFTTREIEVLRLLAEGYDTADIADTLAYSERTIKNVIHDVTSRLHLRNRSHAVAFAMRTGVI